MMARVIASAVLALSALMYAFITLAFLARLSVAGHYLAMAFVIAVSVALLGFVCFVFRKVAV